MTRFLTRTAWYDCPEPERMLPVLQQRGRIPDRRYRRFICACARLLSPGADETPILCEALVVAERYAAGNAQTTDLHAAQRAILDSPQMKWEGGNALWNVVLCAVEKSAVHSAMIAIQFMNYKDLVLDRSIAGLIHEYLGSPFASVKVEEAWLSWKNGLVVGLAQVVHDESAFDRMPILADALEDSGCTDTDILRHLRGATPHVRHCWVLDTLLNSASDVSEVQTGNEE